MKYIAITGHQLSPVVEALAGCGSFSICSIKTLSPMMRGQSVKSQRNSETAWDTAMAGKMLRAGRNAFCNMRK